MLDQGIRDRLLQALERSNHSRRSASVAAGLGYNYLQQLLDQGRPPSVENLMSLCNVLDTSLSYVLLGQDVTPEGETLTRLMSEMTPQQRGLILQLAKQLHAASATHPSDAQPIAG